PRLPGLGLLDLHTVHPGARLPRCIGNVVVEWQPTDATGIPPAAGARSGNGARHVSASSVGGAADGQPRQTLVGFENHGGRTYLGSGARPLGRILSGHGNNSQDGTEGAVVQQAYGTYLHGSLLPKNPHLADHLLTLGLRRRDPGVILAPLDDTLEWRAHEVILQRYSQRKAARRS
ncbi:MAG: hypothetical protein M3442_15450, partial [Chloroflexota bacterium]|nr:hypothetical protein [Chloroflexota bacterium]